MKLVDKSSIWDLQGKGQEYNLDLCCLSIGLGGRFNHPSTPHLAVRIIPLLLYFTICFIVCSLSIILVVSTPKQSSCHCLFIISLVRLWNQFYTHLVSMGSTCIYPICNRRCALQFDIVVSLFTDLTSFGRRCRGPGGGVADLKVPLYCFFSIIVCTCVSRLHLVVSIRCSF